MKENTLSRRIEFLKAVPLFAGLGDADLTTLAGDFH